MPAGSTIRPAKRLRRREPDPPGRRRFPLARQTGRAAGPFAALSLRSECLLGAGSLRRLAMPFRPGIPPRFAVRTSGPTIPRPNQAFPTSESSCVQRGRRPPRPPAGCYALHGPTKPSAPTRHAVAAALCVATAMRQSRQAGDMLEGGQPIRLGTQRTHRPTRPHRHSHCPSDLKVRPPAGGRRLIRAAHEAVRAVCMYDVAGAAPNGRRIGAPWGRRRVVSEALSE